MGKKTINRQTASKGIPTWLLTLFFLFGAVSVIVIICLTLFAFGLGLLTVELSQEASDETQEAETHKSKHNHYESSWLSLWWLNFLRCWATLNWLMELGWTQFLMSYELLLDGVWRRGIDRLSQRRCTRAHKNRQRDQSYSMGSSGEVTVGMTNPWELQLNKENLSLLEIPSWNPHKMISLTGIMDHDFVIGYWTLILNSDCT